MLIIAGVAAGCVLAGAAGLLAFLPARQEVTGVDGPNAPEVDRREAPIAPAERTIAEEASAVASAIALVDAEWRPHVLSAEVETVLRRPVVVVTTDVGPEQAGLAETLTAGLAAFASSLAAPDGAPYTFYMQVYSADGDLVGTTSVTDERWALEAPDAPADAAALTDWLSDVYGADSPAPEPWPARVTSVESDAGGVLTVVTDLEPADPVDRRLAQTIIDAVNSSGADFASSIRVVFADGAFEWSSLLDGRDPYGP